MLKTTSVITHYGRVRALDGVSLHVEPGEIVCLLGANGAGKTTLLRTISGLNQATRGAVVFLGSEITRWAPEAIVRAGLSHVPEGRQLFGPMSVLDNLTLGAYPRSRRDKKQHLARDLERAYALFPVLQERAQQTAATLSGGEQQMLAIARALMGQPKLLMLDEPSLGLAPLIVKQIFAAIEELNKDGLTVFLVEQNAYQTLKLADRGYVMVNGRITMSGTGAELLERKEVRAAYLEGDTAVLKETNGA